GGGWRPRVRLRPLVARWRHLPVQAAMGSGGDAAALGIRVVDRRRAPQPGPGESTLQPGYRSLEAAAGPCGERGGTADRAERPVAVSARRLCRSREPASTCAVLR